MKARKYELHHGDGVLTPWLQWGRADEGAEIINESLQRLRNVSLQWGRADEGAEILRMQAEMLGYERASMGPRR